ncbi:MAG: hypothetical protein ACI35W_02260 [Anaeroplasmataceae bacterium]
MSKEKSRVMKNIENPFYEILGIFIIIFSLIVMGSLGQIGESLYVLFKIIFGDLMIIIFIIFFILGIRCIKTSVFINFSNITFYGVILIFIGISCIIHLSIYNGLYLNYNNILTKSLEMYKYYYNHYDKNYIFGGGMIGAFFLQILMFLFGYIGSIIVSIAIIICGIALITNNSIFNFYKKLNGINNAIFLFLKRAFGFFSNIKIPQKEERKINVDISSLRDIKPTINGNISNEIAIEYASNINKVIVNNKLLANLLGVYVGYSSTTIKLETSSSIEKILSLFENYFVIKDSNIYYIEIKNKFKELLTLKKCLIALDDDKYLLPIGINNMKDIFCINLRSSKYYLLSGDIGSGIRSYIKAFIVSVIIKYKNDCHIRIIDTKAQMREYDLYSNYLSYYKNINEAIDILDIICNDIDKRKEIIKYLNCSNYIEASNIDTNNKIDPIFLIINTNIKACGNEFFTKLDYILKFGGALGIHTLIIIRSRDELSDIPLNLANKICFHTKSLDLSVKLIGSALMQNLDLYGDILYQREGYISHGQTPYIGEYDFKNIIKKIVL